MSYMKLRGKLFRVETKKRTQLDLKRRPFVYYGAEEINKLTLWANWVVKNLFVPQQLWQH